jgi:FMN phosphatase YigB (HAD superfamily)
MAKAKKTDIQEEDVKSLEERSEKESELDSEMTSDQETPVDQEVDMIDIERETATREQMPSEVAAINTDNDTAKEASKKPKASKAKKSKQAKKSTKTKVKSKKYQETVKDFDKRKEHSIEDAVELVKKLSYSKFDGTITLDVKLSKAKKGEEAIRGTIKLPHPTGKTSKVVIANDELIEKIKKGYSDFDIILTSPEMMPKLAVVAKSSDQRGKCLIQKTAL